VCFVFEMFSVIRRERESVYLQEAKSLVSLDKIPGLVSVMDKGKERKKAHPQTLDFLIFFFLLKLQGKIIYIAI
jgi:hypothetical protein